MAIHMSPKDFKAAVSKRDSPGKFDSGTIDIFPICSDYVCVPGDLIVMVLMQEGEPTKTTHISSLRNKQQLMFDER